MTEQQIPAPPTTPPPTALPNGVLSPAQAQAALAQTGKRPPWGDPENFNAEKAWELIQNLRTEKGGDPTLKTELEALRTAQETQRAALATALGVKPEETSDADKLAQQVDSLRGQILASEKRALAIEFKVPEAMLTATNADELRTQATSLAEFAQAAHYAAVTSSPPPPAPAFQPNPGQGQGNTPLSPDAMTAAEYEKYFPPKK